MIVVTGGAGFIGSALVWGLNSAGIDDILVVDHFGTSDKWRNLARRHISYALSRDDFLPWLSREENARQVAGVFHMGARSTTTETDVDFLVRNNFGYSTELFALCARRGVPFIYASSAATYGMGERGYSDSLDTLPALQAISPYGYSKHLFDTWVLKQSRKPPVWAGLKFFNVYGPNEYHKGGQASVALHAFNQIKERKRLKLFKSYKTGVAHGEQQRDFVYVKDVVDVAMHFLANKSFASSGIYNVGTGRARTFADLGRAVFSAMGHTEPSFEWVEMPESLRQQYQYFTQAELANLRERAGYTKAFTGLEEGVRDYVQNYLAAECRYL